MKKLLCLAGAVMLLLALTACGEKPLDEQQLQQAVEAYEDYAWMEAETTDFEVVKRQTNEDDKTDTAWVTIKGKTDLFAVTRSYEVHSVLYNDGWKAEDVAAWYDPETPDSAVPLAGPSEEEMRNYVEWNMDLDAYRTFDYTYGGSAIGSGVRPAVTMGELTHPEEAVLEEAVLEEDYSSDTWYVDITYTYDIMEETVTVPIHCTFDPVTMYWSIEPDSGYGVTRTVRLTDGLVGTWTGGIDIWSTGEQATMSATITEVGDDWFQLLFLDFDSNFYEYTNDSGRVKLVVDHYTDNEYDRYGKLKLSFAWDDDSSHDWMSHNGMPNLVLTNSVGFGGGSYCLNYKDGDSYHDVMLEKTS